MHTHVSVTGMVWCHDMTWHKKSYETSWQHVDNVCTQCVQTCHACCCVCWCVWENIFMMCVLHKILTHCVKVLHTVCEHVTQHVYTRVYTHKECSVHCKRLRCTRIQKVVKKRSKTAKKRLTIAKKGCFSFYSEVVPVDSIEIAAKVPRFSHSYGVFYSVFWTLKVICLLI